MVFLYHFVLKRTIKFILRYMSVTLCSLALLEFLFLCPNAVKVVGRRAADFQLSR